MSGIDFAHVMNGGLLVLKDMKTHTHLKPGQKGTRGLVEQFGDKLLSVRYRYDEIRQVRMKTVEIIVNDHWKLWGFITTPAGDIQINFLLSNKRSVLIQTSFDLERIWTDAGYRVLSNNERKHFQKLLPSNAQQKRSN